MLEWRWKLVKFYSSVSHSLNLFSESYHKQIFPFLFFPIHSATNISDYEGDLSYMDDEIDEITYTNSNQNRKSLTGTSITSFSEDRRGSVSTLNQQNFEEIIKDEDGEFHFKDQILHWVSCVSILTWDCVKWLLITLAVTRLHESFFSNWILKRTPKLRYYSAYFFEFRQKKASV